MLPGRSMASKATAKTKMRSSLHPLASYFFKHALNIVESMVKVSSPRTAK